MRLFVQSDESGAFLSFPQVGCGKLLGIVENLPRFRKKRGLFHDAKIKLLTLSTVLPVENSEFEKIQILRFANLTKGKGKKDAANSLFRL